MKVMNKRKMGKNAIILFTRVPLPGKTKTRLLPLLSIEESAKLHESFLKDIMQTLVTAKKRIEEERAAGCDLFICYTPSDQSKKLLQIEEEVKNVKTKKAYREEQALFQYFPQLEGSMGQKMHASLQYVLKKGYDKVILIGSDIPEITATDMMQSFHILSREDVVLGATMDQGYYLIGLKVPESALFSDILYGQGEVAGKTIRAAKKIGKTVSMTTTHFDIDTPEDLLMLRKRLQLSEDIGRCYYTRKYIAECLEDKLSAESIEALAE